MNGETISAWLRCRLTASTHYAINKRIEESTRRGNLSTNSAAQTLGTATETIWFTALQPMRDTLATCNHLRLDTGGEPCKRMRNLNVSHAYSCLLGRLHIHHVNMNTCSFSRVRSRHLPNRPNVHNRWTWTITHMPHTTNWVWQQFPGRPVSEIASWCIFEITWCEKTLRASPLELQKKYQKITNPRMSHPKKRLLNTESQNEVCSKLVVKELLVSRRDYIFGNLDADSCFSTDPCPRQRNWSL